MTTTSIVTGANNGIGLETARGLAKAGHHVVLLCRSADKAAKAKADIDGSVPGASTEIVLGDLSSQASVRAAAAELEAKLDRLDVLVNNAGIQLRKKARSVDGIDLVLATNHLGPFLLTNLLLPLLERSAPARIVNLASDAHKFGKVDLDDLGADRRGYGFIGMPHYGDSKLMNILFTRELARRLAGTNVTANSVHPGTVATNIGNQPRPLQALMGLVAKSPAKGAACSLTVALDPTLGGVTGTYFVNSKAADDKLSKPAQDADLAARLWDVSAELVRL